MTCARFSQKALAHASGINRTYLSGVERSERNVSIDNIARIVKAFGVPASEDAACHRGLMAKLLRPLQFMTS
jgi:transcriptional regulator with XRE-family HTH domain